MTSNNESTENHAAPSSAPFNKFGLALMVALVALIALGVGFFGAQLVQAPSRTTPAPLPPTPNAQVASYQQAALRQGQEALARKDWEQAETNFQEALRQRPDDAAAKAGLEKAQACKKSSDVDREAKRQLNQGAFEQAIPLFKKIYDECDPDFPGLKANLFAAYKGLIGQLIREAKLEPAVVPCAQALPLRADDAALRRQCALLVDMLDGVKAYQAADALSQKEQWDVALTAWQTANQKLKAVYDQDKRFLPDLPNKLYNAFINIGKAQEGLKRWCEAENAFLQAKTVEGISADLADESVSRVTTQCRTPTPVPPPTETPRPPPPPATYCFVAVQASKLPYNPGLIRLRGRVIDKNNQGVPDAVVAFQAFNTVVRARTDNRGFYVLDGLSLAGPWNARMAQIRSVSLTVQFDDAGQQLEVNFVEQRWTGVCPPPP